ncbi:MAG: reverse transcriptase domain-containing protein [Planctomycetota bacterium]|nr:reverse transcriptase domain-containing protein [Planctomycetota bacterium]
MWSWIQSLFSGKKSLKDLSAWLAVDAKTLGSTNTSYRSFGIPKRNGGQRKITAPNSELKKIQRLLLKKLFNGLEVHPQATGFRKQISFVENARCHQSQKIVVKIDLVDFFPSINSDRVERFFSKIGWGGKASKLLTRLTTHDNCLPQGAPTSPVLSNLVSKRLDSRLSQLAARHQAIYTRYADDITLSFSTSKPENGLNKFIGSCFKIIRNEGFVPHVGQKFSVRRNYRRQIVTGLVVNQGARLPREKRRWLRSVAHRFEQLKLSALASRPSINQRQFDGWKALLKMIEKRTR